MKSKTPFDHKEAGYSLARISEKLRICLGEQFSYCSRVPQYKTVSRHIDNAVAQIDILRDYLSGLACRELPGDLPYQLYYPGNQGVDFSTGLFAKTAGEKSQHRFDIRADERRQAFSDSEKPVSFNREDRRDANIWLFSASNTITEISGQAHQAFHHARAKKVQKLSAKAIESIFLLEAKISRLSVTL